MGGRGLQAAGATDGAGRSRRLTGGEIRDLCVGMFGVQVVWGLQNVNTSRIFQTLGADAAELPILWIAAPVTGLLVQPLVGHWSDRARGRWGRRKPFMVVGAVLTAFAMLAMSAAATLPTAVAALWLLTASINVVMQPFRALTADRLPPDQRAAGFAAQAFFIGAGAVIASALPWALTRCGVPGVAAGGGVPASIRLAFQLGAAALVLTVGWTAWRAAEAPTPPREGPTVRAAAAPPLRRTGPLWAAGGVTLAGVGWRLELRRELLLIAALLFAYGAARIAAERGRGAGRGVMEIVSDVAHMPPPLRRLALTQSLTWFGLFAMWVYAVPAVASRYGGGAAPGSPAYARSGDWVGVLFAVYDGVAACAAPLLPRLARQLGPPLAHALCLALGATGLASFLLLDDASLLWAPAVGIGLAWASVLATPYVLVADAAPPAKVGTYLGIHNIFLVLPQLVAAVVLGAALDRLFAGRADAMLAVAAGALALAAASCLLLPGPAGQPTAT